MILVIDNYDSFTFNLVHYLWELGADVQVHRNDDLTVRQALALKPQAILLSPGPCTPNEAGICLGLITDAPKTLPILGVCLGHQAIGQAYGGDVVSARAIMHGKVDRIENNGQGLFAGLPSSLEATRYHSLAIKGATKPAGLHTDAWTSDGEIMAVHADDRPVFGLQFHPESIKSEHGHALLHNFLRAAELT